MLTRRGEDRAQRRPDPQGISADGKVRLLLQTRRPAGR